MRMLAIVCVGLGTIVLGTGAVACGQEVASEQAADAPCCQRGCQVPLDALLPPVLSKVPGCRVFSVATPTAVPDDAIEHLLKAAEHLEAAGRTREARLLREQVGDETSALLARLRKLEAEVEQLRRLSGEKSVADAKTQILVKVKMFELSRSKLRLLGIDHSQIAGQTASLPHIVCNGGEKSSILLAEEAGPLLQVLEALREDGLVKVLAEPTVVTLSGQPACLQVVAECPVPTPQSDGTMGAQYIDVGTRLDFLAVALPEGRIRLELRPRVCQMDMSQTTQVDARTVPKLRFWELDTTAEVRSGQTLVMRGLVQARPAAVPKEATACGQECGKPAVEETELIVLVTPQIVDGSPPPQTAARKANVPR